VNSQSDAASNWTCTNQKCDNFGKSVLVGLVIARLRAKLAAERTEVVALRCALVTSREANCVCAYGELQCLAVNEANEVLARTSASYSHLSVIDREALRKAVEALTEAGHMARGLYLTYERSKGNYAAAAQFLMRAEQFKTALALLTKGQP